MHKLLDPAKLDRVGLSELFEQYGRGKFKIYGRDTEDTQRPTPSLETEEDPDDIDEWKALKLEDSRRFPEIFKNFFFGCESEDRMTAIAFDSRLNHYGTKLQAD